MLRTTILGNKQAALAAFKAMLKSPSQKNDAVDALGVIQHNFQDADVEAMLIALIADENFPNRMGAIYTLGDQYANRRKAAEALRPLVDSEFKLGTMTVKPARTTYKNIMEGAFYRNSVRQLASAINVTIRNGGASNTDSQYAAVRLEAAWGDCYSEILQGQPNVALLILKNSGALDDLKSGQLKDAMDALVCKIEYPE